uniref:Uncharacterized protein n=1 Tax=Human betaherpesvirus 6 TaxID=10368 RepID=A0A5P9U8B6_9BETA|nr:hypothetical protein [Human betaherpesvirus 6]QFW55169.1 hypothetical protein [Human betaherpesvirus 6]
MTLCGISRSRRNASSRDASRDVRPMGCLCVCGCFLLFYRNRDKRRK